MSIVNICNLNISNYGKAAIYYALLFKWNVFPLIPKRKEPITSNGFRDATTEISRIVNWWTEYPDANVGIRTGKESGFIVIDIDGEIGDYYLEKLVSQYGVLPDTVISITGSGGKHILFKYPNIPNVVIKNKVNWLEKIDIRGDGGYIVAPPSIHPNGRQYEWELSSRPNEIEIAELPNWLLHLLVGDKENLIAKKENRIAKKETDYWVSILNGVCEGQRNNAATSLVGHLIRCNVNPAIIIEFMLMWNQKNKPPLPERELESIIRSIARKDSRTRVERRR